MLGPSPCTNCQSASSHGSADRWQEAPVTASRASATSKAFLFIGAHRWSALVDVSDVFKPDCTCAMRTQLELEAADVSNLTSKQMFLACHMLTEVFPFVTKFIRESVCGYVCLRMSVFELRRFCVRV